MGPVNTRVVLETISKAFRRDSNNTVVLRVAKKPAASRSSITALEVPNKQVLELASKLAELEITRPGINKVAMEQTSVVNRATSSKVRRAEATRTVTRSVMPLPTCTRRSMS